MELCYDGALVLPSSYAVMDEEEMTYLEGGKEIANLSKKAMHKWTLCNWIISTSAIAGALTLYVKLNVLD